MTQTLAAALLWCSLNRRNSRDVISVEFVLHFLHVSTAVIMLFLSVYSSKGNMLSTRSPLSLSLSALSPSVSPTSSLPMAWGNSWLSECSSPLCEHTLIGSPLPPKAKQHGVPAASFLLVLLKKSEGRRKNKKRGVGNHQEASPQPVKVCLFSLSASPAIMRINGVYHISLMSFCQMERNSCLHCLQSPRLPPPPHCPPDSLQPLQSYLLTRLHCSVCSAVTGSNTTEPQ